MTVMADHRKTAPGKSSAKVPAWAVLITMGGTSIVLNFWDATHAPHPLNLLVAGLRGFAPVLAAMFISEAGARFDGGHHQGGRPGVGSQAYDSARPLGIALLHLPRRRQHIEPLA